MNCPKCNTEMSKEITLEYLIYTCPCGKKVITDYAGKEVDLKTSMLLGGIYG